MSTPLSVMRLRDLCPEDKQQLLTWRNMPEVARYMFTDRIITQKEHDRWFSGIANDSTRCYWVITYDSEDVGLINLYNIDTANRRCYWAFYLASPGMRGKGIGSLAWYWTLQKVFEERLLNRLCSEVLAFNTAVTRMHERFGFQREGYLRQHVWKGSDPIDVVTFALLREEWNAKRPDIEEWLRQKRLL